MVVLLYAAFAASMIGLTVQTGRANGWFTGLPSLHLLLLSIPNGPASIQPELAPLRAVLLAGAAAFLLPSVISNWNVIRPPAWLIAFAVALALAALASSDPRAAAFPTFSTIGSLAFFLVLGHTVPFEDLKNALGRVIGLALGVTVAGLPFDASYMQVPAPVIDQALVSAALGLAQTQTAALGLGGIAAAICVRTSRSLRYALLIVSLPVALLPMKRALWLAAVVLLLTWLVLERRRWFPAVLLLLLATATLMFTVQPVRDLWDPTPARAGATSFYSIRSGIFDSAIDRFQEHPVLGDGLGVGNRGLLIDTGQKGREWSAHSQVGTVLAAGGIIGFAILVFGDAAMGNGALRVYRTNREPLPLLIFTSSIALVPFHQVLVVPRLSGLGLLLFVLPISGFRDHQPHPTDEAAA